MKKKFKLLAAKAAIRAKIARIIGAESPEICFTAGGGTLRIMARRVARQQGLPYGAVLRQAEKACRDLGGFAQVYHDCNPCSR